MPFHRYLFNNYSGNDFVNVGTGNDVTIRELAELIMDIVGVHAQLEFDVSKPDGMPQKLMDVSRLNGAGWKAKVSLEEGIQKTYQYFVNEVLSKE